MKDSIQVSLIVAATLIVLALIGTYVIFQIIPVRAGTTISSQGTADIKAMPDLITLYFNIETKGTTANESTEANKIILDSIKSNLKYLVKESEIKTISFQTYENFDWSYSTKRSLGYKTTHSLKVEINASDSEKIGLVIDAVSSANGLISYINYELSQASQNKYKAEALKQATQDAKLKAEAIASGANKKLGKLVSISDSSYNYYPWRAYSNDAMASGVAVKEAAAQAISIQPDTQDITATVSVTYQVK